MPLALADPTFAKQQTASIQAGACFMLEVPSRPIPADVSPSPAREIWFNHCFDKCAAKLVLDNWLIEKKSRQPKCDFIHLSNRSLITGFGG